MKRLLLESVQPLPAIWREDFKHGKPVVTQMNSHHNLPEIFYYLWTRQLAPQGSFVDHVFRMVLFHHSLETLKTHPNMIVLSDDEKLRYCDMSLYRVLQVLLLADHESYIFFDQSHLLRCRREILARNTSIARLHQQNRKDTACDSGDQDSARGEENLGADLLQTR